MEFTQVPDDTLIDYGDWQAVFICIGTENNIKAIGNWATPSCTGQCMITSNESVRIWYDRAYSLFNVGDPETFAFDIRFENKEDAVLFKLTWM